MLFQLAPPEGRERDASNDTRRKGYNLLNWPEQSLWKGSPAGGRSEGRIVTRVTRKAATATVLAGFVLHATIATAAPRLTVWVSDPVGASDGRHCAAGPASPPDTAPILTEADVVAWSPSSGRWRLARDPGAGFVDHCFLLSIDGTHLTRGMILSSHSARLTALPVLTTFRRGEGVELWLSAGFPEGGLLHRKPLGLVFDRRPLPDQNVPGR